MGYNKLLYKASHNMIRDTRIDYGYGISDVISFASTNINIGYFTFVSFSENWEVSPVLIFI